MEGYLYNSYTSFFNALGKLGYVKDNTVQSLLIMTFIYRLVYEDYRGVIPEKEYHTIEKAINCLYGINCLLPYRDYLKMGKLHIGEYAELYHKMKAIEKIRVTKPQKTIKEVVDVDTPIVPDVPGKPSEPDWEIEVPDIEL